jgi:hypothetical protein
MNNSKMKMKLKAKGSAKPVTKTNVAGQLSKVTSKLVELQNVIGLSASSVKQISPTRLAELTAKKPDRELVKSVSTGADIAATTQAVDLFPWPFKRTHKGVIKRERWNALVAKIQKASATELEAENETLHKQIQDLLNERDELKQKYLDFNNEITPFCRRIVSKYGV